MSETATGMKARVPRLRFPEFKDSEAWSIKPLGDVAHFYKGKGLSKAEMTPDGKTACIHYGELFTVYGEVIDHVRGRTNLSNGVVVSEANDVLMPTSDVTPRGLAKASCIRLDGVILSGDTLIVRPNNRKTSGEFLARYIRHREPAVLRLVSGSTVFHIYPASIAKLQLAYPEHAEQQKIADCLSSLDDLIAAHTDKLVALKQHKQGLLEQLFPREGETVPRLRFPEFRGGSEWQLVTLSTFIDEYDLKSSTQDEHEVLTSSRRGLIRQTDYYGGDGNRLTERDNIGFNVIPPRYLTYRSRSDDGSFFFNENTLGIIGIVSVYYPVFQLRGMNHRFFLALTRKNRDRIGSYSIGTSQKVLSMNQLRSLRLRVPVLGEQREIGLVLASLDALITAESDKLAALKQHKQGLLQQLFPAMDEATA